MDALILDPLQEERVTVTGRVLNIPESLQTVGVKTDNKVERIYFELPRYFDGFNDFSEFNFYINYINANGDGDVYYCDDLEIEDDNVVFSWLTDNKLYATKGTAQFTVRAMHSDGRKWNTTIAQLTILDGLETQEAVVEQDYDFINQQFEIIKEHTEKLNALIEQVKANTTNLDNAINTMGQAEWNGNQVRFTDGKGNYGQYHDVSGEFISRDEIYLGYSMSQDYPYSGHAGNYGIDVAKIVGAYKQDGTPTPDNPVEPEFNVINDFYTSGKNLFDINKIISINGIVNNGDGSITVTTTVNSSAAPSKKKLRELANLEVGKTYTLSAQTTGDDKYIYLNIVSNAIWNFGSPRTITQDDLDSYVLLYASGNSTTATISDIQIELGEVATPYTQYVGSSTTPVSLELRALPDGTVDVWEDMNVTRNIAKVTFDNNTNWVTYIGTTIEGMSIFNIAPAYTPTPEALPANKLICNMLDPIDPTNNFDIGQLNTIRIGADSSNIYVCVDSTQFPTLEDWKAYLETNPIDIYYPLATPTTEPLAIPMLTSYYPFTNAWCDSELEPKLIEWHVNNKINYIEKLINEKQ